MGTAGWLWNFRACRRDGFRESHSAPRTENESNTHSLNRWKAVVYLSYITGSGRQRENFADLDAAERAASSRVAALAQGDLEALKLTGRERQIFVAAADALLPSGVSLDIAAREFATAFKILGHDAIIEAARYYKGHVEQTLAGRNLPP